MRKALAAGFGSGSLGGTLHEDLQRACFDALAVRRDDARTRALDFSWPQSARLFAGFLVPAQAAPGPAIVTKLSSHG